MSISNQAKLLEILNCALQSNHAAMLRMGKRCPVSKLSMADTKSNIQNAILLLEADNDEL